MNYPGSLYLSMADYSNNRFFKYGMRAYHLTHQFVGDAYRSITGQKQYENTASKNQNEIDYQNYVKGGYQRALEDWYRNVPGRAIAYPEFSYPGKIYASDKGIAGAMYGTDTAFSNYQRGSFYGTSGLYGIGSRVSRWL